ncbi:hypothetical protein [Subdoligranulum variabile]|uniref:Uncharacterized protein n=1 Tax=Subdoligranulum variabile DSM 15176 TaxID=411471 RepID=D1PPD0_9FIRM|nr:hypothetical protein [Subdoligranulum variabile]EFB75392.1 hypothetical protein SUBVAR_06245 [Subdoligranulum variabile DSM 15176]UWP69065.1 hypothetical protein NQ490_04220 [Subdoligranulum variabile]
MDKRNRLALAYLLAGISAAGRAMLAMPDNTQLQELSLTVLAVVGYLLIARRTVLPLVCGAAQLVLELILCGSQNGGVWVWLLPLLRSLDLWILLLTTVLMLRQAGMPHRLMPGVAALPLAVYTVAHQLGRPAVVSSTAFILFSVLLLWYAVLMIRAYNAARVRE